MVPISGFISSSSLMNNILIQQQQQEILVNVSGGWGLREHRQRISHVSLPWSQTVSGSSLVCVWFCLSGGSLLSSLSQSVRLQLVSTLRLIFHSYNPCDERWFEPPGGSVRAKWVQHLKSVLGGAHSVFNQLWILQQNHRRWQLFVAADVHKEIEDQQRRNTKSTSLCWCTSL